MFNWFRQIKQRDEEAEALLQKAHQKNEEVLERAKHRSEITAKKADKTVKQVYDVAKKIHIATGHH